jgi:Tfp pilus assembly protein PilO
MKNNRIWLLGTVIVVAAIVALGWLLGISPKLAELSASEREVAAAEAVNQDEYNKLLELKKEFENIDEVRDELEELQVSIPDTDGLSDFIRQINTLAAESGIAVKTINTESAVEFDLPENAVVLDKDGKPVPAPPLPKNFARIPITIEVEGSPEGVFRFVQGLQSGERLFLATKFGLVAKEDAPSAVKGAPPPALIANVSLGGNLYVLVIPDLPESGDDPDDESTPTPTPTPTPTGSASPTPTPTP